MIYEYLESIKAIGERQAASTSSIMLALHIHDRRQLVRLVQEERTAGRLVCSSLGHGGYYLPQSDLDIIKQRQRLEKTLASRAAAVQVFRDACEKMESRKAAHDDKKETRHS